MQGPRYRVGILWKAWAADCVLIPYLAVIMPILGAILRSASQSSAERADCDRTYPSLLERGLRQPTISVFIDIAVALRVEPATLVDMTLARLHKLDPTNAP